MPSECLPLASYLTLPRSPETWLVKDLLPVSGALNIYGKPKVGKALALDTPILTPSGWRTMADIEPGDSVYGSNGQPTKVVAVSEIAHDRPCYRVTFSNDAEIVADAEHLWQVTKAGKQCPFCNGPQVLTTQELVEHGTHTASGQRTPKAKWHVELPSAPIEYNQSSNLPLDPYCLGTWLGDGTSVTGTITTADPEIIEEWIKAGWETKPLGNTSYGYRVKGLSKLLKTMGLLGNKHIPVPYLTASAEDRLALLAGLLDTDGCAEGGAAVFYNTNEGIAKDTYNLAVGLGLKVTMRTKRAKLNGEDYGICYIVRIRTHQQLFRLSRKAAGINLNNERYHAITSIEPIPSVPVKCIVVEASNHLFLAGRDLIVTHNSYSALQMARAIANPEIDDWLTFPIETHGPVLYLQLDAPRTLWSEQIDRSIAAGATFPPDLYVADREIAPFPFDILTVPCFVWLREQVNTHHFLAVFIDTLREFHRGDEDSSQVMQGVTSKLVEAIRPAAMVLISHSKKDNLQLPADSRDSLMNDNRGSSYVAGRMDGVVKVTDHRLIYQSRTMDERRLPIRRREDFFWDVENSDIEEAGRAVLGNPALTSLAARAQAMASITGRTEEACRSYLRRRQSHQRELA